MEAINLKHACVTFLSRPFCCFFDRAGPHCIEFTGHGQISLRAEWQGAFIRFSVHDSGCGIAEENRRKVFDKFKQIGTLLTDRPHGTGLGLSIYQQIVRHHGGEIWLKPQSGAGSIFFLAVPVHIH